MGEIEQSKTEPIKYRKVCICTVGGPIGFHLRTLFLGDCQYDSTRLFVPDLLKSFFACNPHISISLVVVLYIYFFLFSESFLIDYVGV